MERDVYQIKKIVANDAELERYRVCFENNGTKRNIDNLVWLHRQNLVGSNMIYYATFNEELAGIYTALPVYFKVNKKEQPVLQSIDTITDNEHRGKGLFTKLAKAFYEEAPKQHYTLVYGFPNENSASGFFNKLKWVSFGEVPFLLKPLNPFYFIQKFFRKKTVGMQEVESLHIDLEDSFNINAKTSIKKIGNFDDDYELIWSQVSKGINISVDRSAKYMNWRYVEKPGEIYYKYGLYIEGILQGIAVFTVKHKHDGVIGYVMELIYNPTMPLVGKQLLKFVSKAAKKAKADAILTWCLSHSFNYRSYKRAGFYQLPEKVRPQKLFFGVRVFDDSLKSVAEDIRNWYISYSDSDTV